ncbi:hypothetical protein P20429_2042 [Pseudoalteromonas sp. BSi20429]|nr:hypothetical protein P20429_2042 [Pseudoalteromonas sp. BSi20429]
MRFYTSLNVFIKRKRDVKSHLRFCQCSGLIIVGEVLYLAGVFIRAKRDVKSHLRVY